MTTAAQEEIAVAVTYGVAAAIIAVSWKASLHIVEACRISFFKAFVAVLMILAISGICCIWTTIETRIIG